MYIHLGQTCLDCAVVSEVSSYLKRAVTASVFHLICVLFCILAASNSSKNRKPLKCGLDSLPDLFRSFQIYNNMSLAKLIYDSLAIEPCWEKLSSHLVCCCLLSHSSWPCNAHFSMETLDCLFHTLVKSSVVCRAHFSQPMLMTMCEMHWFTNQWTEEKKRRRHCEVLLCTVHCPYAVY